MSNEQLQALAKRIPPAYIERVEGKFGDFVSHANITQMLLAKIGPFDQRIVQVISNPDGTITGCVVEFTFTIDGRQVTIQEVGEVERPTDHNGQNAKLSVSDAVKRGAMRVGLGLELWAQEHYALDRALAHKEEGQE